MRYTVKKDVRIGHVAGVSDSYGPGGYGLGYIGRLEAGRKAQGGPMVPGPWGYLFGHAGVIDNHGGTAAEIEQAKAAGLYLEEVANGDELEVDGYVFVLEVGPLGHLALEPRKEKFDDVIMLTSSTARLVTYALETAVEELDYRISDLSDTGDYEPEDIEEMSDRLRDLRDLQEVIRASFKN